MRCAVGQLSGWRLGKASRLPLAVVVIVVVVVVVVVLVPVTREMLAAIRLLLPLLLVVGFSWNDRN